VGESAEPIQFENEFYVSEITNYPENEIVDSKYAEFCGEKAQRNITSSNPIARSLLYHVSKEFSWIRSTDSNYPTFNEDGYGMTIV